MLFDVIDSKHGLSLERLITLCRVAHYGSIVAAAHGDENRQSQYSRQIKELSHFFGEEIAILDKTTKPYHLTKEGQYLAKLCSDFFCGLEDLVRKGQNKERKIVVGAGESLIQWHLIPNVWPELRAEVRSAITFRNLQTTDILAGLLSGEIDIGCVRKDSLEEISELDAGGNWPTRFMLFVPKKIRRNLPNPISFGKLAELPIALLEGNGYYRSILDRLSRDIGVELLICLECTSLTQIATLVSRGECCGILPALAKNQLDPKFIDHYFVEGIEALNDELCFAWSPQRANIRKDLDQTLRILKCI